MNANTINAIRDLSVSFEESNLQVAYELMEIAHHARPDGPFIKKKYLQYKQSLTEPNRDIPSAETVKLLSLVESGDVAIIPIGFRCHTKKMIKEKIGFSQASLPFDSGFFSPHSIASIFSSPKISLSYTDEKTHAVCKKYENFYDE